jgi:spermidine/putrescine transport system permease protein
LVSTFFGTIASIGMLKLKKKSRDGIIYATNLSIMNPEIVTAISLLVFFLSFSFQPGYLTMLIAHIAFCTPYVLIAVYPRVKKIDPNLIEAAMDLGATPPQALRKVLLPQLKTAIISALSISFTMSFDDFLISYFTGGSVQNISTYLYQGIKRIDHILPTALAFTTILALVIGVIFLLRYIYNRTQKSRNYRRY